MNENNCGILIYKHFIRIIAKDEIGRHAFQQLSLTEKSFKKFIKF